MNKKAYALWIITCLFAGICGLLTGSDKKIFSILMVVTLSIQIIGGFILTRHSINGTKLWTAVLLFVVTVIPVSLYGKTSVAASVIPLLYGYSGKLKDEYDEPCVYNWKQVMMTVLLGAVNVCLNHIVCLVYGSPLIDNIYVDIILICGVMVQVAMLFKEEKKKNEQLEKNVDVVRKESNVDTLTGLYNRKMMEEFILTQLQSIQAFSVIMMDIDNFKRVNDTYGHAFGDEVLKGLSSVLKEVIRKEDVAFRYGGEEFIVVCPATSIEKGFAVAERIREAFKNRAFSFDKEELHFSISLGVSQSTYMEYKDPMDIIKNSDAALYVSKRTGKDKVTQFEPGMSKEE